MDDLELIAPCGLECFLCMMYMAKDSPRLRLSISDRLGIPIERVACHGCRDEDGVICCNEMTEPCSVFQCSRERGVRFCCDCEDFPCERYQPYADRASEVPHNIKVYNLCLIKKLGVEEFIRTRAKQIREKYFKGRYRP